MDEEKYIPTWSREDLLAGQAALDEISKMPGTGNSDMNLLEAMFNDPRLAGIDSYFLPDKKYPHQEACSPEFLKALLHGYQIVSTKQIADQFRQIAAQDEQQIIRYLNKGCFLDTEVKYHLVDDVGFDDTGVDFREVAKALASEIGSELEVMAEEGY